MLRVSLRRVEAGSVRIPPFAMLSSPYERSGTRRQAGRAEARRDLAQAFADASPTARRDQRAGAPRKGQASARATAQATQAGLAAPGRPARRGSLVWPYRDSLALWGFWVDGFAFGGHGSPPLWARAALTPSAPDTRILAVRSDRLPAARQPWQEQQPAPQRRAVARSTPTSCRRIRFLSMRGMAIAPAQESAKALLNGSRLSQAVDTGAACPWPQPTTRRRVARRSCRAC